VVVSACSSGPRIAPGLSGAPYHHFADRAALLSIDGPLAGASAKRGSSIPELTAQVSALFQRMLAGVDA
jgi:hypothetical protein